MPTYRVDPDALRRLASRLDDTVAELGDAATVAALLARHGYRTHAATVADRTAESSVWCLKWRSSLADRAAKVEQHQAIFDRSTLISADGMDAAIAGLDYATLSRQPRSFVSWHRDATRRQSEVARLEDWLTTAPDGVAVAERLSGREPEILAELARSRPDLVGSLAGAPLDLRILANRLVLSRFDAELAEQIRTLREASVGSPWAALGREAELTRLRTARTSVRALLDRHLVFFEPGDPLRVGEWIGPLDAEHVLILVPGAGVVGNPFDRMVERAHAMLRIEPTGGNLAVVVAQVYAPPPNLGAAMLGRYADVGGPELADFVAGLPLSGAHLTLVGHSYGSTVIGEALHRGLGSRLAEGSDVVVLGSPGMRAGTVTELGLEAEHTWVGLAPGDEVQAALRPLALPGALLCATGAGLEFPPPCNPTQWLVHGRNPAHIDFGAQVFATTPDKPPDWLRHDDYFTTRGEGGTERPSPALANLLHIAAGQYDKVDLAEDVTSLIDSLE